MSPWKTVGIVVAAAFVIAGLAFVAYIVFFFISFAQWGSNK